MKILFLAPDMFNGKGGILMFNNYLVKALLELGHIVSVVSINDTGKHNDIEYSFIYCGENRFLKKPLFAMTAFWQTLHFKPDIILCGHINFTPLCKSLNNFLKIPYFTIAHGIEAWDMTGLKRVSLKNSHKILSVSRFTKDKILEQLPDYPEENVFILPNTFDPEKFVPKPKPQRLMAKWGIKENDHVLLTIARLSKKEKYKGYDKVITAMKSLIKEGLNVKYIIGGSGDDADRIKELIKRNDLEDRVILTGFIPNDELVDYYNLCDVFVMPSEKEGFGIVFLEALACGKPVIAGNKDGSRDAVLDGEIGILVDPDNIEELRDALEKILKGNLSRKLFDGAFLRERVIEEYGFDKFRIKVKEIINRNYELS